MKKWQTCFAGPMDALAQDLEGYIALIEEAIDIDAALEKNE